MFAAYRTHSPGRCCRVTVWILLPALVFLGTTAGTTSADDSPKTVEEFKALYPDWKYTIIPIPPQLTKTGVENGRRLLIGLIMKGDSRPEKSLKVNEKDFDAYFRDIQFRRWTHPNRLAEISKDRVALQRLLQSGKNPEARARVNGLIIDIMPKFAGGNYHPALRYNAMLLLGELNSKEQVPSGDKAPAVPLTTVLPILLDHATRANLIDAVRVAALIGVRRHADTPMPTTAKARIITDLLPLLSSDPPAGRSPEGHAWMQRQTIEILGALGDAGPGGAVANQLQEIVADAGRPLSLRCAAATSLGQLPPVSDPLLLAGQIGSVGVEACRVELTWLKERIERRLKELAESAEPEETDSRGGGRALGSDLIGSGDDGEVVDVGDAVLNRCKTLSRRRLRTRLNAVNAALNGLSSRAGAAKTQVTGLASTVSDVATVLDDADLGPEDLQQRVFAAATKLEDRVKGMRVPAKAPAAAAGGAGPAATPGGGESTPPKAAEPDEPEDIPF